MTLKEQIEELKGRIKKLERDSHKPVFKEETYSMLDCRIQIIESFFDKIEKITTDKEELQ